VSHESADPVVKPRPVDGAEIVRLAMEWRHWEKRAGGEPVVGGVRYGYDQQLAAEALDALRAAVDTRL
jgi:hypothetical protein